MSSRVIRGAGAARAQAQPIRWRAYGQAHGGAVAPKPERDAAELSGQDAERLQQARAAAYQQGVTAGEAAVAQRAQARLDPFLANFANVVAELEATRKELRAEAEQAAVALALEVARRILHREIAADREAILGLIKAAFQKSGANETRRIRLAPEDAEMLRENLGRLNLPTGLEIAQDRSLPRGSAIFETSRGELDASVDTQLAEIERGFADVLARRQA